jgi:hypothetical protein
MEVPHYKAAAGFEAGEPDDRNQGFTLAYISSSSTYGKFSEKESTSTEQDFAILRTP